jgi:hypothetical protein
MIWLREKLSSKALLDLQSGDNLYSRKLDAKAIISGQKQANGHLHYVVEIQHGRAEPVEILMSPTGLALQGYKVV